FNSSRLVHTALLLRCSLSLERHYREFLRSRKSLFEINYQPLINSANLPILDDKSTKKGPNCDSAPFYHDLLR
ncbi:hypothetical protein, partial [Rouxiella silvae]